MSIPLRLIVFAVLAAAASPARADNFFVEWKERLFGAKPSAPDVKQAPDDGPVVLGLERPERFKVGPESEQRDFPQGRSRFREVELQREFDNIAVRIQVVAEKARKGRGNTVFKPILYVLDDEGKVRDAKPVEPLYLDIRPFKPTRLLACISLEKVRRFAVATTPEDVGKTYDSKARDKIKAPTRAGFYYSTDPVTVKLPYVDTGQLVVELVKENDKGSGC